MKYNINLLPIKESPMLDRIIYFSLNYLRYIIIITQLVVIAVFFYRFQIDQHIVDLKEGVDQKKEIIQVVLPLLNEADVVDKRTTASQKIINSQTQFTQIMQYLTSIFPASATLTKFDLNSDALKITGATTDARQLQAFYNLLKKDNKFSTVSLNSIKKTDAGYTFELLMKQFKGT